MPQDGASSLAPLRTSWLPSFVVTATDDDLVNLEIALDANFFDRVKLSLDPIEMILLANHQLLEHVSRSGVAVLYGQYNSAPVPVDRILFELLVEMELF